MKAIEHELAAWHSTHHGRQPFISEKTKRKSLLVTDEAGAPWDARESMLRGCVGLDVTAFFLMVSVGIIDLLSARPVSLNSEEDSWGWVFDLTRLRDMLQLLLQSDDLHLAHRLEASLCDQSLSRVAYQFAGAMLELADIILSKELYS
jgi:hypothetical protein